MKLTSLSLSKRKQIDRVPQPQILQICAVEVKHHVDTLSVQCSSEVNHLVARACVATKQVIIMHVRDTKIRHF